MLKYEIVNVGMVPSDDPKIMQGESTGDLYLVARKVGYGINLRTGGSAPIEVLKPWYGELRITSS